MGLISFFFGLLIGLLLSRRKVILLKKENQELSLRLEQALIRVCELFYPEGD